MILQKIESLTFEQLSDILSANYWEKSDFWIFICLSIIGIIISVKGLIYSKASLVEASKAKDAATAATIAANRAGKMVKNQSILLTVSEATKLISHITKDTNYDFVYAKLMDVNSKIRNIIGFYGDKEGLSQNHQNLLTQISENISNILIDFNLLDPENDTKVIYNKIRPAITSLSGYLSELQGVLENEVISNN